ncbi:hypothetical protein ACOME3_006327 [Neoechinorhynchus agilis]
MLTDVSRLFVKVGQPERRDDDIFDKISRRWTVILLAVFLLAIASKHYFGDPIECWTPAEFKSSHNDYVKHYCWITYTYHVGPQTTLSRTTLRQYRTGYYIWVPFVFTISALFFYTPCWVWNSLGHRVRYDLPRILNLAVKGQHSSEHLEALVDYYDKKWQYIEHHDRKILSRLVKCLSAPVGGGTATAVYMLSKILYLINAVSHFFLLNFILGFEYKTYGIRVLKSLIFDETDWQPSAYFPRSTFCDIGVRYKGDNYNNYTIQCALPVNLFHEKIFAILWFWYAFVVVITTVGILYWLALMSRPGRIRFIRSHLHDASSVDTKFKQRFDAFFSQYLAGDGVLMLRLVSKNSNCSLTCDLLNRLWFQYLERVATSYISGDSGTFMSSNSSGAESSMMHGSNAAPGHTLEEGQRFLDRRNQESTGI